MNWCRYWNRFQLIWNRTIYNRYGLPIYTNTAILKDGNRCTTLNYYLYYKIEPMARNIIKYQPSHSISWKQIKNILLATTILSFDWKKWLVVENLYMKGLCPANQVVARAKAGINSNNYYALHYLKAQAETFSIIFLSVACSRWQMYAMS